MAAAFREALRQFAIFTYAGVDPNVPGNGGEECYSFLSVRERLLDTVSFMVLLVCSVIPLSYRRLSKLDVQTDFIGVNGMTRTKKILLISLCITFGIELGYKLATNQLIFLLNPCHIITVMQIYFLCAEENRTVLILFRIHIHILFGAFLAIILPVVNTRLLPGEVAIYWVQHILIFFIIPPYLISTGGAFTPESLYDYTWPLMALVVFATHMFIVLQGIGMLTLVNLNSMLCPAVSDPFYGPYYRWFAIFHQSILVLCFGKIYTAAVKACIRIFNVDSSKDMTKSD